MGNYRDHGFVHKVSRIYKDARRVHDGEPYRDHLWFSIEKLIAPLAKQNEFVLDGTEYVRKKPAPTDKIAEWYNKKSFSLIHSQQNGPELFSPELTSRIVAGAVIRLFHHIGFRP